MLSLAGTSRTSQLLFHPFLFPRKLVLQMGKYEKEKENKLKIHSKSLPDRVVCRLL